MRRRISWIVALCLTPGAIGLCAAAQEDAPTYRGKTVAAWKTVLKNGDTRQRLSAVLALGEAGRDALPALPELAALLKDRNVFLRRAAAQTLAGLGADAAVAVPALAMALRDSDPLVRQLSAQALGEVGDAAVPPLLAALKDNDPTVRATAALTLDGLGARGQAAVKVLAEAAVKDTNSTVRRAALSALAKMGADAKEAVPVVAKLLRSKEGPTRTLAAFTLVKIGKASIPEFTSALMEPNVSARVLALQALSHFEKDELDGKAVLALVKALADEDARVRTLAGCALGLLGPQAPELGGGHEVIAALLRCLKDADVRVRRMTAAALSQVGLDDKEDITTLAAALQDKDANVRGLTVHALSQYSHDKAPDDWRQHVMTCLADALKDADRGVRLTAAKTLAGEGKHSVPGLLKILENTQGTPRLLAAATLGEIGAEAAAAVPALEKMVRDSATTETRTAAQAALAKIQP